MIYNDYHVDSAIMIWEDDDTININGHIIDFKMENMILGMIKFKFSKVIFDE